MRAGRQDPEHIGEPRLPAGETGEKRRVEGVRDAAEEVDRLPAPDLEGKEEGEIATEDDPQRSGGAQRQGDRHAPGEALAQKHETEDCRHDRCQGEDGRGRNRRRGLQSLEHRPEIEGEYAAEDSVAPRTGERPRRQSAARLRQDPNERRRQNETRGVDRKGRDLGRGHCAQAEGSRDAGRKAQHRRVTAQMRGQVQPFASVLRNCRKVCTFAVR